MKSLNSSEKAKSKFYVQESSIYASKVQDSSSYIKNQESFSFSNCGLRNKSKNYQSGKSNSDYQSNSNESFYREYPDLFKRESTQHINSSDSKAFSQNINKREQRNNTSREETSFVSATFNCPKCQSKQKRIFSICVSLRETVSNLKSEVRNLKNSLEWIKANTVFVIENLGMVELALLSFNKKHTLLKAQYEKRLYHKQKIVEEIKDSNKMLLQSMVQFKSVHEERQKQKQKIIMEKRKIQKEYQALRQQNKMLKLENKLLRGSDENLLQTRTGQASFKSRLSSQKKNEKSQSEINEKLLKIKQLSYGKNLNRVKSQEIHPFQKEKNHSISVFEQSSEVMSKNFENSSSNKNFLQYQYSFQKSAPTQSSDWYHIHNKFDKKKGKYSIKDDQEERIELKLRQLQYYLLQQEESLTKNQ